MPDVLGGKRMKLKEILKERMELLQSIIQQSGKRLSSATIGKINGAIETLSKLIDTTDDTADEAEVSKVAEQAFAPVGSMLLQALVTGESTADSYQSLTAKLWKALRDSEIVKDMGWTYIIYTWTDHIVFSAEKYKDGKYTTETYRADYSMNGDSITFSNLQKWSLQTVGIAVQSAIIEADGNLQQDIKEIGTPTSYLLEQAEGENPLFLQVIPNSILQQGKTSDGRTIFSGVATQGNVLNKNTPPIVYPTANWEAELPAMQSLIQQGKALGAFTDFTGHPTTADGKPRMPSVGEYSHKFTKLEQNGDLFPFQAEVMNTPAGQILQGYFDSNVSLDMSTVAKGKVKKGTWEGQQAYIAQSEGFKWLRIADVVLQGASPGSEITDVRLQSLTDEQEQKGKMMSKEEIMALIQSAMEAGNSEEVAALKAQLAEMKGALEQAQGSGLTDEDRQLLQQARDRDIRTARDEKINQVVDAMVTAKELPQMFKASAVTMLQSMTAKAEDVDGMVPAMKTAMAPMLQAQAEMQSKGFYVKEFEDDGKSVNKVQTVGQAIDELIQTRIERGIIPKDTGVQDPSNMAWCIRTMLQTMAREHPETAKGYMMLRNGDLAGCDPVDVMQQSYSQLMQDIPTGAMTTSDVATAIPYLMPIVGEFTPQLVAARYASLQPMTRSVGSLAYWKIKDQDGNNIKEVANFTGSYANDPGEKQTLNKLKGGLTTENISPIAKKLGYDLSVEVIRRLRTDWGIDASSVMVSECANEIAREWNYNHLQSMVSGATAGNRNFGTAIPADSSYDGEQWQKQIINYLAMCRSDIRKKTFAGTVAILGDSDAITRITWLAKEVGAISNAAAGSGYIARGVNITGQLSTGEELVSVDWWESLGMANKLLIIGRGQEWYRSGYIVAPYLGLYVTPQWVDPGTLDVEQGMLSEVAEKMVEGDYFGTLTILPGTPGIPL